MGPQAEQGRGWPASEEPSKRGGRTPPRAFRAEVPTLRVLTGTAQGLRGTGPRSRRAAGEPLAAFLSTAVPHRAHLHGTWRNYLPRNQSLVPERLGTAALEGAWP